MLSKVFDKETRNPAPGRNIPQENTGSEVKQRPAPLAYMAGQVVRAEKCSAGNEGQQVSHYHNGESCGRN